MATQDTPEWHSDDITRSQSLATTILDDEPRSEPAQGGRDEDEVSEQLLLGGAQDDASSDDISRAVQRMSGLDQPYSKKQLRIIFRMEPRTTRRVLQAGGDEYEQARSAQIVKAAGKRLTLSPEVRSRNRTKPARPAKAQNELETAKPQSATQDQPQGGKGHLQELRGKGKGAASKGRKAVETAKQPPRTQAVQRSYSLLAEEWPIPIREITAEPPYVSTTEDGIYMLEDQEQAKAAALAAAKSPHRIAIVTPGPISDLRLAPLNVDATLLSETQKDKGSQRTRTTNRCRAPVHVYNLTTSPAFHGTDTQTN